MTDVLKTEEKKVIRRALIAAAFSALNLEGWKVESAKGEIRGRVRRITKNGQSKLAAIRTSQDHWIAFPRTEDDSKWLTLSSVDVVIAAVVDDPTNPQSARVHMFDARDLERRFDRTLEARRKEGHQIQLGRGLWLPVYEQHGDHQVYFVGGGIGVDSPAIATVSLSDASIRKGSTPPPFDGSVKPAPTDNDDDGESLTIAQAKPRLARMYGVDPANIKIIIEG
jgi:hypothetical protein